jgi:hypothetical protein
MGRVFEFPSQQVQGLAYLDRQLRTLLESKGADEQLVDFAASQLTQIYAQLSDTEQYIFSLQLPPGISDQDKQNLSEQMTAGLEGIRQENHAMMVRLVAQLVLAEVRLYQHERAD